MRAAWAVNSMARIWQRLQQPSREMHYAPSQSTKSSATVSSDSLENKSLPFIEVGTGGTTEVSEEIANYLRTKSGPKRTPANFTRTKPTDNWNWPKNVDEWHENQIAKNILEVISKKIAMSSFIGLMASDAINPTSLSRLLITTSHHAAQDCSTLILSGDLPLPVGMPKQPGIREYLTGSVSIQDICHPCADGKAALLTGGYLDVSGLFSFQENTYLGLLKALKRRYSLSISAFHQTTISSLSTTYLGESEGVFAVAREGEDSLVERWQKAIAHQGINYLGWIVFKSEAISPVQSNSWESPSAWRQAG